MLASMLQRRGNSDELDDEIFKNALSTNYLGMSSLSTITHPLTPNLAGVETVSSAKGFVSFLELCLFSDSVRFVYCILLRRASPSRTEARAGRN